MKTTKKIRKIDWHRHGLKSLRKGASPADDKQLCLDFFDDEPMERGTRPLRIASIAKPRADHDSGSETRVARRPKAQG